MENTKNNFLIIVLLTLILGLTIGYYTGTNTYRPYRMMDEYYSQNKEVDGFVGMHGAMNGMMMGLSGKTGDELDLAFLSGMIIHHEGAIEMSQTLLKNTKRPELIKLGNDIITAQTKEIEMMKEWRKEWFN